MRRTPARHPFVVCVSHIEGRFVVYRFAVLSFRRFVVVVSAFCRSVVLSFCRFVVVLRSTFYVYRWFHAAQLQPAQVGPTSFEHPLFRTSRLPPCLLHQASAPQSIKASGLKTHKLQSTACPRLHTSAGPSIEDEWSRCHERRRESKS